MSPVEELLQNLIRPMHLLCVEDDAHLASVLQAQLHQDYECEVDWAPTGEDALKKLGETVYDLVLLDLILPGMSGVEVLRHIKRLAPNVPVVIMTGFAESPLALEACQLGVISLLIKPFGIKAFEEVFNLFKIRIRSKENSAYFKQQTLAPA